MPLDSTFKAAETAGMVCGNHLDNSKEGVGQNISDNICILCYLLFMLRHVHYSLYEKTLGNARHASPPPPTPSTDLEIWTLGTIFPTLIIPRPLSCFLFMAFQICQADRIKGVGFHVIGGGFKGTVARDFDPHGPSETTFSRFKTISAFPFL